MPDVIKPLPQTTKGLLKVIQSVGCFFRSSQAIAEMEAGKTLSIVQINSMWMWARTAGFIDDNNLMKASAPIANKTLDVLGVRNKKFYEIATSEKGVPTFYKSIPQSLRQPKYFIRKIRNQFNGTHFLVVDSEGKTIFDPDNSAEEVREIYTILYTVGK